MKVFKILALSAALAQSAGMSFAEVNAPQVGAVLDRLSDRLPAIRTHLTELEQTTLESSMFRRDLGNIQSDLDWIMDEIIGLLVGSEYASARTRLFELEDEIETLDQRIGELRIAQMSAPASPAEPGLVDWAMGREFAPGSSEAMEAEILRLTEDMQNRVGTGVVAEL